jgi:ABC-type glycerol-3-phosphate transport system substrate-binding protein
MRKKGQIKLKVTSAKSKAVGTILAAALATGAWSAGASASGRQPASSNPKSITVLIVPSPSATALEAIAPTWTKMTGIKVKFVSVPYDEHVTKIVLNGESRSDSFDIAQFDQPGVSAIVPALGLESLDGFIKKDPAYDINDFPKSLQAYGQLNGVTYGLPLSTEPYVNFYRTDIYKKLGLTPATTWAQEDANAAAVSKLGGTYYGFDGPYGPTIDSAPEYFERLLENGGRLLNPTTYEPLLDTPIAISTMEAYLNLAKDSPPSTLSGTAGDSATDFTEFNVGSNLQPSGWWGTLDNPKTSKAAGLIGVAPVPAGSGGPYSPINILKGWLIGINPNSPYQQADWAFLSFALGKQEVPQFIAAGAPVPGRLSTIDNPKYQAELPYLKYYLPGIEHGTTLPNIPELTEITTLTCEAISAMANEGKPVPAEMKSLNTEVTNLLIQSGRIKS